VSDRYFRMPMARAATKRIVASETVLWTIVNIFARRVIGTVSVGLNAVAVQNARKR